MQPALVVVPGRKHNYDVDVELMRFTNPKTSADKTFTADVAKIIADIPRDTKDIDRDEIWSYSRTMRLAELTVVMTSPSERG